MITVAGTLVADLVIGPVGKWPGPGKSADIDYIEIVAGGAVANTGMALARLGVPVSACAAVGTDNLGAIIKDFVNRWATRNAIRVIPSRRTTASIVAISKDRDRSFLTAAGACDQFQFTAEEVESEVSFGSRALHIGYTMLLPGLDGEPLKNVMRAAGKLGVLTSLDVTYYENRPWADLLKLMPEIDVFCPSLSEARLITGESDPAKAARALVQAGVRQFVAVTNGEHGVLVEVVGAGQDFIPALPVQVINTTGAGDAFIAGVLAAWYRGLPWWSAARVGSLVASLAVTSGRRYDRLQTLERLIEEFPPSDIPSETHSLRSPGPTFAPPSNGNG
jgi:sugar/nucleoside kinase (ribokinase family)